LMYGKKQYYRPLLIQLGISFLAAILYLMYF